jgi:hypothetical protein
MSIPTAQQAPAADETEAAASPVLGEITVGTADGARVIRWSLGTAAVTRGLTVAGMAAAAAATGRYLAGVNPRALQGSPQVRIAVHLWEIPVPRGDEFLDHGGYETAVAALMTEVVNTPGSIGQLA